MIHRAHEIFNTMNNFQKAIFLDACALPKGLRQEEMVWDEDEYLIRRSEMTQLGIALRGIIIREDDKQKESKDHDR